MSDGQFGELKFLEETTVKTAETAKEIGIVHEIEQAAAPIEAQLFNIEY